jgi:hypothetical protein
MDNQKQLREHVLELLQGKSAHIDLERVIRDFPINGINTRVKNAPHTAWDLLEHIRIAQWDILEFSRDAAHVSPEFPEGFWPTANAGVDDWQRSVEQILEDLHTMRDLVADENIDLFEKISHGDGQTILREALLVADHNAYHLGQLVFLGKMLEDSTS